MKTGSVGLFIDARFIQGFAARPFARALAAAVAALLAVAGVLAGSGPAFDQSTLAASKSFEGKLQTLGSQDAKPSASYPAVIITEREVNSYMRVHSHELLPAGVSPPTLIVQPEHSTAAGDVDFATLSRSYPNQNDWGPKILAAMFKNGTEHVTVTAKVQSENSGVRLQIEKVVVGSMTVPNWLLDYFIQNVLQPTYKFDLSKPLPYPDHVTQIVLGSGQATFFRKPIRRQ